MRQNYDLKEAANFDHSKEQQELKVGRRKIQHLNDEEEKLIDPADALQD